jgi:hypothetical protein
MHMQHATYGHPKPPCSRRGCVFPYDLVRRELRSRASNTVLANAVLPIFRPLLCPTTMACTSTDRVFCPRAVF